MPPAYAPVAVAPVLETAVVAMPPMPPMPVVAGPEVWLDDTETLAKHGPISIGADGDEDGVVDEMDNCPYVANPKQSDANHDGLGDACESSSKKPSGSSGCSQLKDPDAAANSGWLVIVLAIATIARAMEAA